MRYGQIKLLNSEEFRRLTGVKRETFEKMLMILRDADKDKKSQGGRKNKLCLEDQLLLALEYLREYRTYFHISKSYGISERSAYKTVKWIEDTLIKHRDFALPGRKTLALREIEYDVVLIDATETPIERPKKDKGNSIPARRKGIH